MYLENSESNSPRASDGASSRLSHKPSPQASETCHPNIKMRYREDTERSQNVGSGSDSNLSTASPTIKDSFSLLEEDKKSAILINIAGLSGKAA